MNYQPKRLLFGRKYRILCFFLLSALVAEMIVIYMDTRFLGGIDIFILLLPWLTIKISSAFKWIYAIVGPMFIPLGFLTILQICFSVNILAGRYLQKKDMGTAVSHKVLKISEVVSPMLGFLGTVIALMFTMWRMDPNLSQTEMLKVLIDNSASAFGSTVYGISQAIIAYLTVQFLVDVDVGNEKKEEY